MTQHLPNRALYFLCVVSLKTYQLFWHTIKNVNNNVHFKYLLGWAITGKKTSKISKIDIRCKIRTLILVIFERICLQCFVMFSVAQAVKFPIFLVHIISREERLIYKTYFINRCKCNMSIQYQRQWMNIMVHQPK